MERVLGRERVSNINRVVGGGITENLYLNKNLMEGMNFR